MRPEPIPVLEVGGTHVTAVLVSADPWEPIRGSLHTVGLDADGTAAEILDELAAAAHTVDLHRRAEWVVAIPGPFDYQAGIGLFRDVGKFDSLHGIDVRAELHRRIRPEPLGVAFLNDADAFGIGEYASGAARDHDRALCITVGTGIGSAFLDRGRPVNSGPTVPPDGSIHLVVHQGRPLEETVSRRAIRAAYAAAVSGTVQAGEPVPDVLAIAERSRRGDEAARSVLRRAFVELGTALAPLVETFDASVLVIGGSIAVSWDVVEPAVRTGLTDVAPDLAVLDVLPAQRNADAALLGAAFWSATRGR